MELTARPRTVVDEAAVVILEVSFRKSGSSRSEGRRCPRWLLKRSSFDRCMASINAVVEFCFRACKIKRKKKMLKNLVTFLSILN